MQKYLPLLTFTSAFTLALATHAEEPTVYFDIDVKPILEHNCLSCHNEEKDKGDLRLETRELTITSASEDVLVPGQPDESSLYTLCTLPADDDDVMPPIKKPERDYLLPQTELDTLRTWIAEGAEWPEEYVLRTRKRLPQNIDFVEHIQPILEYKCVACHYPEKTKGKLRLDTKEEAFKTEGVITPGDPINSSIWWTCTLPQDDELVMPPPDDEPLSSFEMYAIRRWIEQGAQWPDNLEPLLPKTEKNLASGTSSVELYQQLGFQPGPVDEELAPYTEAVRGIDPTFNMIPITGGTYTAGSPPDEAGRDDDEGPQFEVTVGDFWIAETETTWELYEQWAADVERKNRDFLKLEPNDLDKIADGVTRPTPEYTDMTFGMGREGYPAICMTQLSAKTFCMWLSAKTGKFYRLPTEAEWEYACRAGTTTPYFWGDDPAAGEDYVWYADNSNWAYQPVGTKEPNPWGLHDMAGSVWEWCLDSYAPDSFAPFEGDPIEVNPIREAIELYPRSVRGGSWDDPMTDSRSAARMGSDPVWKKQDPQIPKSVWYHTDALWVGFRIVRPKIIPPVEEIQHYWPTIEDLTNVPTTKN